MPFGEFARACEKPPGAECRDAMKTEGDGFRHWSGVCAGIAQGTILAKSSHGTRRSIRKSGGAPDVCYEAGGECSHKEVATHLRPDERKIRQKYWFGVR